MKTDYNLKSKKPLGHIAIYLLFAVAATMILLNRYTALYINETAAHFIFLCAATSSFVVIIGHFFGKLKTSRSIITTFLIVCAFCFLKAFLTWGGDWKTETVLYQNKQNSNKTIEFQLRGDRFAFGYKKRTVARLKLLPFIDWITDIDTSQVDHSQWQQVKLIN